MTLKTLRTDATEQRYQEAKKAGLTQPLIDVPALMEWKYWKLIKNDFPHDLIHSDHDLLIPLRVFSSLKEMNLQEATELYHLLSSELANNYDTIKINYPRQQTVLNHFHIHLVSNYKG